ncbi:MAG: DUF2500 domain-containing protein [Sedimentibacter saalensis]|uniref:DUF2500 domain-containing protein n=1 Tax=Sedimentibacter saalensis TaxID=130788 RepID=UPI002B215AEA|nr:DUF2500 domain-containing protein [Sedimentibacter saalensis]MEA5096258.1 DUF2500 domain-containing protein [Sedimentibacter saalensis]
MGFINSYNPFGLMFTLFPIMFIIVFGVIIFSIVKNISVNMHNNKQPVIPVEAKVVTKRYNVSTHHHNSADNNMHHSSSTYYYVTFELNNGERLEFPVPSYEFGMLVEGDSGTLSFQGTRFVSFIRM